MHTQLRQGQIKLPFVLIFQELWIWRIKFDVRLGRRAALRGFGCGWGSPTDSDGLPNEEAHRGTPSSETNGIHLKEGILEIHISIDY